MGNNEINNNKKHTSNAGNFDYHADAAVRCGAHRPMKHIPGFTRSHCMPPSGECFHCMAVAAAVVDNFGRKYKTLTTNYF
jgi:hypothetical protein